jgi:hypothetical protein
MRMQEVTLLAVGFSKAAAKVMLVRRKFEAGKVNKQMWTRL